MDKGLDVIKDKISANAQQKVDDLIAAAKKNAAESKEKAEAEYQRIIEEAKQEAKKHAEMLKMRSESLAEANRRRADSDRRQKLISQVTDRAIEILASKSTDEKVKLYEDLLRKSGIEEGLITLAEKDAPVAEKLLKKLGPKFKEGKKSSKITGGLIVECGDIAHNMSYDLAVRICRREIEKAAADILYAKKS